MFNRQITRRVPLAVQQKNDIASLNNNQRKSLEQRVLIKHETNIVELNNKLSQLTEKVNKNESEKPSTESNEHTVALASLKEQCDIQSNLLKEYEEKVISLVDYIKRLEKGLDTVKELLTNTTNTPDTVDTVEEEESQPSEVVEEEEESQPSEVVEELSQEITIEGVQEESSDVVSVSVSLEIVDEETI